MCRALDPASYARLPKAAKTVRNTQAYVADGLAQACFTPPRAWSAFCAGSNNKRTTHRPEPRKIAYLVTPRRPVLLEAFEAKRESPTRRILVTGSSGLVGHALQNFVDQQRQSPDPQQSQRLAPTMDFGPCINSNAFSCWKLQHLKPTSCS
jgi:hypothetical protein